MTSGSIPKAEIEKMGLVKGHAYTFMKMHDEPSIINPKTKKQVVLMKMRNPWGEKEWTGDWSDNSDLWTDELKKLLKVKKKDDGVFFMDINDFKKYFGDVEFGYYRDHYKYDSLRFKANKKHAMFFNVDIQKKGEFYFTIC